MSIDSVVRSEDASGSIGADTVVGMGIWIGAGIATEAYRRCGRASRVKSGGRGCAVVSRSLSGRSSQIEVADWQITR